MRKLVLYLTLFKGFSFFFHFGVNVIEVAVKVLKNHVELFGDMEDFFEFGDVGMIKFSEGLDFPQIDALVPS